VSIDWRVSLVPAAAVIPAPVAYTNIAAVKKLVVECRVDSAIGLESFSRESVLYCVSCGLDCALRRWCCSLLGSRTLGLFDRMSSDVPRVG